MKIRIDAAGVTIPQDDKRFMVEPFGVRYTCWVVDVEISELPGILSKLNDVNPCSFCIELVNEELVVRILHEADYDSRW